MQPEIKPITIELTAEEVLGLRHIHSHWANSNGNAPFCDFVSDTFLEKLGGHLQLDGSLWDHPVAAQWYADNTECEDCQLYFPNAEITDGICPSCAKERGE